MASDSQGQAITEEERDAREFARDPIDAQPEELQTEYYTRLTEAHANGEAAKLASIQRLEAVRDAAGPTERAAIDEAIRIRQKVVQDRARDLAYATSQLPPSQ